MKTLIYINFYSPRWEHEDRYSIEFDDKKIHISTGGKEAECIQKEDGTLVWSGHNQKIGNPFLKILSNDQIYPPSPFINAFITAWGSWKNKELTDEQLKSELTILADWVNITSRNQPDSDYWIKIF